MKTILTIVMGMLFASQTIQAQRIIEKTIQLKEDKEINLDFDFANQITVTGWDKNEVYIKATVNINDNKDNDHFSLEVSDHSWFVEITTNIEDISKLHQEGSVTIRKNKNSEYVVNDCNSVQLDLIFEVKIPKNNTLEVNTISGDIEVEGLLGEVKMKSISGFIDLSLPSAHPADIKLNTVTGSMYTSFNLSTDKDGMRQFGSRELTSALNGGGKDVELETVSGNIYLRELK